MKLEMVLIPAGEFLMGSPDSDRYAAGDEKPQHRVRITRPFYLGKYPVTQEQWEAVMGGTPSQFKGPNYPVEQVSWDDCQQFCESSTRSSAPRGREVPLPRKPSGNMPAGRGARRAIALGTTGRSWANMRGITPIRTAKRTRGREEAERMGLYDMHGNVWEWCQDWYDDDYYADSPEGRSDGA